MTQARRPTTKTAQDPDLIELHGLLNQISGSIKANLAERGRSTDSSHVTVYEVISKNTFKAAFVLVDRTLYSFVIFFCFIHGGNCVYLLFLQVGVWANCAL